MPPCVRLRPALFALLLALTGCSSDGIYSPQKFFPGKDLRSWGDCSKFGPGQTGLPEVCAGFYMAPGAPEATFFISFYLPNAAYVRIAVYDENAKLVKVLLDQEEPANTGDYRQPPVEWDLRNLEGERVPPGEYRLYLRAGDYLTASDVEVP